MTRSLVRNDTNLMTLGLWTVLFVWGGFLEPRTVEDVCPYGVLPTQRIVSPYKPDLTAFFGEGVKNMSVSINFIKTIPDVVDGFCCGFLLFRGVSATFIIKMVL